MSGRSTLHRSTTLARNIFMIALPHGGQGAARRNAWAGMSRDAALGRARTEAETALHDSVVRHAMPAAHFPDYPLDGTGH